MDFNRLTLEQIENLDLEKIPMTMEDTDNIIDPIYYEKKIVDSSLPPVQWSKKERKSITKRVAPILANTNAWLIKKNLRMKQLPASSRDDDNSDGPIGKTATVETRTKSRVDPQALSSALVIQSKGKGPKIKFTVKGSKKGESSLAVQEAVAKEPKQSPASEVEKEKGVEEGEISQQEEVQAEETSHPAGVDAPITSQVIIHSIDSDFDQEDEDFQDGDLSMGMAQSEAAQQFFTLTNFSNLDDIPSSTIESTMMDFNEALEEALAE